MVKKCAVVNNNDAITVIKFDDTLVQLPSIHENKTQVHVAYENGKYFVVDRNYESNISQKKMAKSKRKSSNLEEIAEIIEK